MTELATLGRTPDQSCSPVERPACDHSLNRLLSDPEFHRWLHDSCTRQNVPVTIADSSTLMKVAALFR